MAMDHPRMKDPRENKVETVVSFVTWLWMLLSHRPTNTVTQGILTVGINLPEPWWQMFGYMVSLVAFKDVSA
jgi:hypothetical protein